MTILLDPSCPFRLDLTLCCGQAFRWEPQGEWWYGVVRDRVLKVRQAGARLQFENADETFVKEYFGLHDDLRQILSKINKDSHLNAAVEKCGGLRILRQDPWECLISYVCATFKNIAAIKRMLRHLSRKFGERISFEGRSFYAFPTSPELAKASDRELRECELGYRAKFVSQTAKKVSEEDRNLKELKKLSYDRAREELLSFPGVGPKVADCILLFSLEKLEAFPVDVWIKRAIFRHYFQYFPRDFVRRISHEESLSNAEYRQLNLFGREYFGEYAGYAQEYMYHYERTVGCDSNVLGTKG